MDLNRVIGNKGRMPWHIPADLKHFAALTKGHPLVMGHTTYKSVGALPGRYTYILTNNAEKLILPRTDVCRYIDHDALETAFCSNWELSDRIWVCGGATVYKLLLPRCTEVYATIILDEYEGDTYMPHFEDQFPNSEILQETKDCWMVRYWK